MSDLPTSSEPDAPRPVDLEATAVPETAEAGPPPTAPVTPVRRRRALTPLVYLLAFIVLAGGGVWLWQNPEVYAGLGLPGQTARVADASPVVVDAPAPVADVSAPAVADVPAPAAAANVAAAPADTGVADEVAGLRRQVQELTERVARLEAAPRPVDSRPAPPIAAVDLSPLSARLDALEHRPAPPPPPPGASPADLAALGSRLTAQDQQLGAVSQTLAGLSTRVQSDDTQMTEQLKAVQAQVASQVQAVQGRLAAADKLSAEVSAVASRATRQGQLQVAAGALQAGRPLGAVADLPPPLARFADAAPPTEAALRLSFPQAAAAAMAAAQPATANQPFLDRVWGRMQQAVTVRAGDRVIVGNPAAGVLARAQSALDAGDLAGTVADLQALPAESVSAMADWLGQARALLAARAALADLAAHA